MKALVRSISLQISADGIYPHRFRFPFASPERALVEYAHVGEAAEGAATGVLAS